jgi:glycosyltransferase involved in cell wall biosynthesis
MHQRVGFDVIVSFDLALTGGLTWRLGRELGLPATGWATGDDVRVSPDSSLGRSVIRALQNMSLVFYQSHELLEKAAELLGTFANRLPTSKHIVLPRGIPAPPPTCRKEMRSRMRKELNIDREQVLVLSIGRISREKGAFELIDAMSLVVSRDPRVVCLLVGSSPEYDETILVCQKLKKTAGLEGKVRVLPACHPETVWKYLCAADLFAFTSHHEGMPNSLLEAMAMGVPTIAFAIPPVVEIEGGKGVPLLVRPFDPAEFSKAILQLAKAPHERARISDVGKSRIKDSYMVKENMAKACSKLRELIEVTHQSPHKVEAVVRDSSSPQ